MQRESLLSFWRNPSAPPFFVILSEPVRSTGALYGDALRWQRRRFTHRDSDGSRREKSLILMPRRKEAILRK